MEPETSYPCDICGGENRRKSEGDAVEVEAIRLGTMENYFQLTMWACEVCKETYHLR